jgi:hypothetical protein
MNINEYIEGKRWQKVEPMAHKYVTEVVVSSWGKMTVNIKDPIVTIELLDMDMLLILGMAYCRPDDRWNPIIGVKLALDSAIARGNFPKDRKDAFWAAFKPHADRILKKYKTEEFWNEMFMDDNEEDCDNE